MTHSAAACPQAFPKLAGYTVTEQIYAGSRTAVYRALQTATQKPVIIKVLRREYPSFGELVQFRNQYAITKNLPIPGITHPLSLEPLGNSYALVLEDWDGIALNKYLQQQSLGLDEVLTLALQLCDILHDLAQHRVIHKDIKPANILIQPESKQIKLIDFSIASLLPKETQEVQSASALEGTLAYLAPEQTGRMNRGIDYRTDFYALGVTLYELLSGTLPFDAEDPLELMHCHIAKMPLPVDQVNPKVPRIVAAIIGKLMAKNAEDRYQSAMGLKHDLEQCLTQWNTNGAIAEFELGQRDISDRFLIPEKLYGREQEVQTLLQAFERVANGGSELMLVAGFSGIGKTAVVNEVHKPIVRQRGYFIKGKFDQFNRNIPLSAFVQALRSLMRQLLSESDEQLAQWKQQILIAVGENGQILIEVIPELEQVIGTQPPVAELSGSAAQNRFNRLFQKFIEVFTTAEHPLVIFLDDLQWADSASLDLLKLLMNDSNHLLLIGAYRDNEVSPVHPFIMTVSDLQKAGNIINTIDLKPLTFEDTNHLVSDTLNCSHELAQPLTELVNRKTQGNPFFTTQFLKSLYKDGYIHFNHDRYYWECDIVQVNARSLTDDVVEFMMLQLQKLPNEVQHVLKLAACIGNQFDLSTLAIISEQSVTDAATVLWEALKEGLIIPTTQVYKFFQGEQTEKAATANPSYRFFHDRVQQAAYSLIDEARRQETHHHIGQLLIEKLPQAEQEERLFDIVNHMNAGFHLSNQKSHSLQEIQSKQIKLAELNLAAGRKARLSTAYDAAINYLKTGISLLACDAWKTEYSLMFQLHRNLAEVQLSQGNYPELETTTEEALKHIAIASDRADIEVIRIIQNTLQGNYKEAIQISLNALSDLGIKVDHSRLSEINQREFLAIEQKLEHQTIHDLIHLHLATDPLVQASIKVLMAVEPVVYITGDIETYSFASLKATRLSLEHGNTVESIKAYANYGFLLGLVQKQYQQGYEFIDFAVQLSHKLKSRSQQCKACLLLGAWAQVWAKPIVGAANVNYEGFLAGVDAGEIQFAGYNLFGNIFNRIFQGEPLGSIKLDLEKYWVIAKKHQNEMLMMALAGVNLYLQKLQSQQEQPTEQDFFAEADFITRTQSTQSWLPLCLYHILKIQAACLNSNFEEGFQSITEAKKIINSIIGFTTYSGYFYYTSLIFINRYSKLSIDEQSDALQQVRLNQQKLREWADSCPENFLHKYILVEAEYHRVLGEKVKAVDLYDRAIVEAQQSGFTQEAALANEFAARFYLDWGKERIAQDYLINAYYCYMQWGATAKTQSLEQRYPQLLEPVLQPQNLSVATTETAFAPLSLSHLTSGTHSSSSSSTGISASLDLTTILKASQSLSREIQLDKLLAALLHTVLENAGADKGALLLPQDNQWFVEAIAAIHQPAQIQSIPLSSCSEVSQSLINLVKRSQESVVIVDASSHPTLAMDSYVVEHQIKSLLCTPILQLGKLVAILYLENRVTAGAFTSDRVELLNLLCTQAAISLENARLYQQAQAYAQQLKQSQLQIVQSEKMASLGNLVAGVAHEINNPIGFLNGSINNAREYVKDLLDYISLYQQHHPNAAAPVQEKAEAIDLEFLCEDLPKLLDSMRGATDRIKGISTSLRTFSRADRDHKVRADLHEGIDSTLLILKYRLKANELRPAIEIIKEYGDLPEIDCFPGQLNQVFMNILANAIDMFDEMAQTQSFDELQSNAQQIAIRTATHANQVEIQICDNGKGMTEAVRARIFDYLFTTKEVGKGTGLGLAIARQIVVEKHGGTLDVHSQIGSGTEFIIRLPISDRKQNDQMSIG
ncbi:AAA family ATPase [Thermoleptolyngbya oregonensis NK1-22]|uniref:histidine kinase n=1 Tax=Thermoleptolyngbya oregonensis NK1-22 TaxID=2547457 RepID=A0AA96Y1F3_9CYAN|nr:AAA family ATPase [Thermoleptolyngbya oregonensis NK1-22]